MAPKNLGAVVTPATPASRRFDVLAQQFKFRKSSYSALATVFVSSRFDELGSSRCAAFRAINDNGCAPNFFEAEDYRAKTTARSTTTELASQRERDKALIDRLVDSAECFVGIYAFSLGTRHPQYGNLSPIEYEFLRFVLGRISREKRDAVLGGPSGQQTRVIDARPALAWTLALCCRRTPDLGEPCEALSDWVKGSTWKPTIAKRAQAALQRTLLLLKESSGDRPIMYSLATMACLINMERYSSRDSKLNLPVPVYHTPFRELYSKISKAVAGWRSDHTPARVDRWETTIAISSTPTLGFLADLLNCLYMEFVNVERIEMGYHGSTANRIVRLTVSSSSLSRLQSSLKHVLDRYEPAMLSPRAKLVAHKQEAKRHALEVIVANYPGYILRVLSCVAANRGNVVHVDIRNVGPEPASRLHATMAIECPAAEEIEQSAIEAELSVRPGIYLATFSAEVKTSSKGARSSSTIPHRLQGTGRR